MFNTVRKGAWMAKLHMQGHTAGMSIVDAFKIGARDLTGQFDVIDAQYRGNIRVVEEDGDFRAYQIEHSAPIWTPRSNSLDNVLFLIVEHALEPYFDGSHRVHPGDVVLDVGGNVGLFTRAALKAGASVVHVMEPAPENIACLRRTFSSELANGRVVLIECGAWSESTDLTLHINPLGSGHNSLLPGERRTETLTIPVRTIDSLRLPRVDFIKIDIEGVEANALRGAHDTLAHRRPRLSVATEHSMTNADEVRAMIPRYRTWMKSAARLNRSVYVPEVLFATPR
jgi:FkbM family methyltransferase